MKATQAGEHETAINVVCDVCCMSTRNGESEPQYGTMHASWGKGSAHCGEEYELHLCESCFFSHMAEMKRARWLAVMFDEKGDAILGDDAFGRVTKSAKEGGGEPC
ncbi:hypothetical protein PPUJ20028_47230 [Pseudomonas putida]|uniref:Uncharacterized protein n=1 Tax=Pseudomonas putida TaxID=303 RepID=A0AA37VX20_PSEPU|nr:hypothetical protein [Pseudomonas putida]GLO16137.1 hypothetical protein PPUJ20028_47230 [Pseudomonas putida]GLO37804.1 hypothetical protein PPUN14671_46410 [Pseudomonas putida]HDS0965028.1 hypothetical protein [Pseudomonas putida]HDS0991410.1 hypothetical protein [Pseudomonas putida]